MASYALNPNLQSRDFPKSMAVGNIRSSPSSSSSSSSSPPSRRDIDLRSERFLVQNHRNFGRSDSPDRIMFYKTGMWSDFPSRVVESLRLGFTERKSAVDLAFGESNCVFDFLRMLQIDLRTGNRRSIAWIDKRGQCFFPREFVSGEFADFADAIESPNVKIEIRVEAGLVAKLGKRMRESDGLKEEKEVTSSFRIGDSLKRQRLVDDGSDSEDPKWPNVKLLSEGDSGYLSIRNIFLAGIRKIHPEAVITAIHQCTRTGPMEKARRAVFCKQIEITKAARGSANVAHAWYSASKQAISEILAHGFRVSNGDGVCLSPLALPHRSDVQSEPDDNGEKHLILCSVIFGNIEKVEAVSQQRFPSRGEFDTGADDPKNPKWFVVWPTNMSRHILPECVVSYKSFHRSPARLEGLARSKYSFPELFTKIKSSLSPVKVQECISLYETLKSGKIAKDVFIKQFRVVAGEKVLLSAIGEICGAI